MATPAVSRRDFLRVGVGSTVAAATVLTQGPSAFAATGTVATFTLSPTSTAQCGGTTSTGCSSCNACRTHATNKLFRSTDAAGSGRAHPGCLCAVAAGPAVSSAVFADLFGDSTASVDRRDPRVASVLERAGAGAAAGSGRSDDADDSGGGFDATVPFLLASAAMTGFAVWLQRPRAEPTTRE